MKKCACVGDYWEYWQYARWKTENIHRICSDCTHCTTQASDEKWRDSGGGESVSELMIGVGGGGQLQEIIRGAVLLGCFYFWYIYSNLSRVYCC